MKEYTQTIPVGKIRLTKEDLHQLMTMSCHRAQAPGPGSGPGSGAFISTDPAANRAAAPAADPELTISTRLPQLLISEETLEDFLRQTDLPPYLDNLSIRWASGPAGRERIPDRLSLQLGPVNSQLRVSGMDETWVLGKCEQLIRFLRSKQASPAVPGKNTRILLTNLPPFWKVHKTGLTLLLALLSLAVAIILCILQFFRK